MAFIGPAGDPRWGAILQDPNVNGDRGQAQRAREIWMARQSESAANSSAGMTQLAAALKAARDKQLADMAAADALRAQGRGSGGGGGGRSGGGGGSTPLTYTIPTDPQQDWYSQYVQGLGDTLPPPMFTPAVSQQAQHDDSRIPTPVAPNYGLGVGRQGRGFKPRPPKKVAPTKYNVRIS